MRYHTALPPRLNSQKQPQDPAVQRSPPTCELSLANASACTTSADAARSTDPEAMEVDLPASPPETPWKIQLSTEDGTASKRVQPSRKHSLLRSTVPRLEIFPTDASAVLSNRGPPSPTEQSPPRKRTRTSALSSPSRPRPHRLASLPTRPAPLPPSSTPLSPSFVASGRQAASTKSGIAPVYSSHLPFSPIFPTPNVVADLVPSAAQEQPHSTRLRRRKPPPSELKLLTSVYRSLVYGLEMRYPRRCRFAETRDAEGTLARTCFDTQDALLAHHLKPYLLLNGASRSSMVVDLDLVARERVGSTDMDVDSDVETSPRPGLLPNPSTNSSILSYQQLVSALILRHHMYPRRSPGRIRKKGDAARKTSALAKSHTFEFESS